METWQIVIGLALFLVLMFQRWFWFVTFTMSSLAAGAESLASIMHFHITGTLGYAILMPVFWSFAVAISDGNQPHNEGNPEGVRHPSTDVDHPDWSPP